jgi:hypothetical protein
VCRLVVSPLQASPESPDVQHSVSLSHAHDMTTVALLPAVSMYKCPMILPKIMSRSASDTHSWTAMQAALNILCVPAVHALLMSMSLERPPC